uniref:Uncharacterized protein n=1 Tax=Spongospora subterranea TaxID=70186 RepID=A0A0H5QTI0_9EUKA|eukprot:CRZ05283.1 hypothetical protein [Spongospora subterranea]
MGDVAACIHVACINYLTVSKKISNPSTWTCDQCSSNTESVWICLQCAHTGCGRTCKNKHAQKHYNQTRHPVVLHINQKMLFCYDCDDWILNDNQFGYVTLLREQICRLQNQTFDSMKTRSGSVIPRPKRQFQFVKQKDDDDVRPDFSAEFTAQRYYHLMLQKRCVASWKLLKFAGQGALSLVTTPCNSLPPSPRNGFPGESSGRRFLGRTGLRNIGNTCYQNATLMCLSSMSAIRRLLYDAPDANDIAQRLTLKRRSSEDLYHEAKRIARTNTANPAIEGKVADVVPTVLCQMQKLFRVIWSGKWAGVSPAFFVKSFMMTVPSFQGYMQHDAHEFLTSLLEAIIVCKLDIQHVRDSIRESFTCKQVSSTTCHQCKTVSQYRAPGNFCITLDLDATCNRLHNESQRIQRTTGRYPRRQSSSSRLPVLSCSLEECLDDLVAPVELAGTASYRCESTYCSGSLASATKKDQFISLPQCILFHINRTKWDSKGKRKIMHRLKFPINGLDLSRIVSNDQVTGLYRLMGIVLHHGCDIDQGHYTSLCYQESLQSFVAFNDLASEIMMVEDIADGNYSGHPYLLFYEIQR